MKLMEFLRDVAVPALTLATTVGLCYLSYLLAKEGAWGAMAMVLPLIIGAGVFLEHDVRRLFLKG